MKKRGLFVGILIIILCLSFVSAAEYIGGTITGDKTLANGDVVAGNIIVTGKLTIPAGAVVNVKNYDGTNYGWVNINANEIEIAGTLNAWGAGYGGGGGAGGAGGGTSTSYTGGTGGTGGAGRSGGSNGIAGTRGKEGPYSGASGGAGGDGAGTYKGTKGSAGAGGQDPGSTKSYPGNDGTNGNSGKYCNGITSQCDTSTDESLSMGSGGGGAGGGGAGSRSCWRSGSGGGGGAGGTGGGSIKLYATNTIIIKSTGKIYANAMKGGDGGAGTGPKDNQGNGYAGGNGGRTTINQLGSGGSGGKSSCSGCPNCVKSGKGGDGGDGGAGAGGGILLKSQTVIIENNAVINSLDSSDSKNYAGTLKIFYVGTAPSTTAFSATTGRIFLQSIGNPITCYEDSDSDGYGNAAVTDSSSTSCISGYVDNSDDCNDADASIKPEATEVCNDGVDNNCNSQIDCTETSACNNNVSCTITSSCTDSGYNWSLTFKGITTQNSSISECSNGTNKYCCPTGYNCVPTGGDSTYFPNVVKSTCQLAYVAKYCWDFNTTDTCPNTNSEEDKAVGTLSVEEGILGNSDADYCYEPSEFYSYNSKDCFNITYCQCKYNVQKGCFAYAPLYMNCTDQYDNTDITKIGACNFNVGTWEDKCDTDGVIFYSWTAEWEGNADPTQECINGNRTMACTEITTLPFFTWFNFIVVAGILFAFYYFSIRKK